MIQIIYNNEENGSCDLMLRMSFSSGKNQYSVFNIDS